MDKGPSTKKGLEIAAHSHENDESSVFTFIACVEDPIIRGAPWKTSRIGEGTMQETFMTDMVAL